MDLRFPDETMLPSYVEALSRGWYPSNNDPESGKRELKLIEQDSAQFLASLVDIEAKGEPVVIPGGATLPRIPGYKKWMWDGEFCGGISFRWSPDGGEELPSHVLGHIGYGVVDWKQRQGYASQALKMILADAAAAGFRYVEITTDADNNGSQKVIEGAGGILFEQFMMPEWHGGGPGLRYRVPLIEELT